MFHFGAGCSATPQCELLGGSLSREFSLTTKHLVRNENGIHDLVQALTHHLSTRAQMEGLYIILASTTGFALLWALFTIVARIKQHMR